MSNFSPVVGFFSWHASYFSVLFSGPGPLIGFPIFVMWCVRMCLRSLFTSSVVVNLYIDSQEVALNALAFVLDLRVSAFRWLLSLYHDAFGRSSLLRPLFFFSITAPSAPATRPSSFPGFPRQERRMRVPLYFVHLSGRP